MKKFLSIISFCLVSVFCLVTGSGCSCSRQLNVKGTVTYVNFDVLSDDVAVVYTVEKKYREPQNTPCYKEVKKEGEETKYELIEHARNISSCYDAEGNQFEKAIDTNVDRQTLKQGYISRWDTVYQKEAAAVGSSASSSNTEETEGNVFTFTERELPENEKYSLIYTIKIINKQSVGKYYLKKLNLEDVVDLSVIKNEEKEKEKDRIENLRDRIKLTVSGETTTIDEAEYHVIKSKTLNVDIDDWNLTDLISIKDGVLTIELEIKSLDTTDVVSSKTKNLNFNFNFEFYDDRAE